MIPVNGPMQKQRLETPVAYETSRYRTEACFRESDVVGFLNVCQTPVALIRSHRRMTANGSNRRSVFPLVKPRAILPFGSCSNSSSQMFSSCLMPVRQRFFCREPFGRF